MLKAGLLYPKQEILFNGNNRVYIDLNDPEPRNVYLRGVFDPFFFKVASTFTKSNSHFFDVGSNVVFCSFGLTNLVSSSVNFHLFEANKNLFSLLLKLLESRISNLNDDLPTDKLHFNNELLIP